jgi:16S rRNA (cytidine1402-2'-O)-methyltransferase
LADLAKVCGPDRDVVVARELTKLHEEVWRGTLGAAVGEFEAREVRGEVVIVLAGAGAAPPVDEAAVVGALRGQVEAGASWRDATAAVAAGLGVSRRRVYEQALALRRRDEGEAAP